LIKQKLKKIPGVLKTARWLGIAKPPSENRRFLLETLPANSVGAEIGVHLGDFSERILAIAKPKQLHLVDPWEHQQSEAYKDAWYGGQVAQGQLEMDRRHRSVSERFSDEIAKGTVVIHRGYSTDILERFADGELDWVYIDANHMYDFVMKDLEASFRKVKSGGLVTGDDYTSGGWWAGGVKKAVDEYAEKDVGSLLIIKNSQFIFRKN
jgi:hypothetical protein